uniref:Trehalase n=1 Tax=Syphacia muris TaxID=451379 RepID=A0A0N5AJI6_9BILA
MIVNVDTVAPLFPRSHTPLREILDELKASDRVQVCDGTLVGNQTSISYIMGNYSMIYCSGDLLAAVSLHRLFNDSKTFVDMPMKADPHVIISEFNKRFNTSEIMQIDRKELKQFIDQYFLPPGTDEFEECELPDWQSHPPEIMKIKDVWARDWALELNAYWKKLCRKLKRFDADRHSLLFVPNEFFVPGGRFREFYYWDTYWIVKGLLVCGMTKTVEKILENFQHLISKYGFIPNGGRIYYLRRSQPPMFAHMVYEYYKKTGIINKGLVDSIARELYFWKTYRTAKVNVTRREFGNVFKTTQEIFKYFTPTNVPRPEAFYEDLNAARYLPDEMRKNLYTDIASTAEAGWSLSTRFQDYQLGFFIPSVTKIVPLDLNAFICGNIKILSKLMKVLNNTEISNAEKIKDAMYAVFYNSKEGIWSDFKEIKGCTTNEFFASLSALCYSECYSPLSETMASEMAKQLMDNDVLNYPGGIPASFTDTSGLNWDFPNSFPPLHYMFSMGLYRSKSKSVKSLGEELLHNWIETMYFVYRRTGKMWEKYDASKPQAVPGSIGEYGVQSGYGSTNGIVLDILTRFPDTIWLEQEAFEYGKIKRMSDSAITAYLGLHTVLITLALLYNYNIYFLEV